VPQSDSRRFVYDRFGNRAAMYNSTSALSPAAQTISLQPLSGQSGVSTNRISQVTSTGAGTVTYAHDRAGNVRNDGVTAYTFDVLGRIDSATTGATMSTFQYDSANRRIQKKVGSSPAIDYVWEGGHVLAEYDRATGVYTDYVWAGSRMVASVRGAATTFHHQDRLSTRLSTDASGNVIGTQSHFPFGEDAGTSGTVEKHRFTSYERDTESGTDYAVNRQNGFASGRFMRPDPVAGSKLAPQSSNRYSYTRSDPVNLVDSLGLNADAPLPPPGRYKDPFGNIYWWNGLSLSLDFGSSNTYMSEPYAPARTIGDLPRLGVDIPWGSDIVYGGASSHSTSTTSGGGIDPSCDSARPRTPDAKFVSGGISIPGGLLGIAVNVGVDVYGNVYAGLDFSVGVSLFPISVQYQELYVHGPYSKEHPKDAELRGTLRGPSVFASGTTWPVSTTPGHSGAQVAVTDYGENAVSCDARGTPGASVGGELMGLWWIQNP